MAKKAYIGLPKKYTQVAYIESNGTQYIDTGLSMPNGFRAVINVTFTKSAGQFIIGSYENASPYKRNLMGTNASMQWKLGAVGAAEFGTVALNTAYELDYCNVENAISFKINGIPQTFTISGSSGQRSALNLYLFGANYGTAVSDKCYARLSACKIYEGDTLLRDYVPCVDTNGEAGLYDKVSNKFFTNIGTGTFAVGTAVSTVLTEVAKELKKGYMGGIDDLAKKVKKAYMGAINPIYRRLPEEYTQVEYIQSNGTQYIDTGYKPNQDTRVKIDLEIDEKTTQQALFGARVAYKDTWFVMYTHPSVKGYEDGYANQANTPEAVYSGRVLIDKNKNKTVINGVAVSEFPLSSFTTPWPIYLLTINNKGSDFTASCPTYAKLFSCKIYDHEILVRDYVPCINLQGIVGMYDLVNNVFYENAGTGSFTAGPVIYNNPVAYLFFDSRVDVAAMVISYSGNHTDEIVTMGDGKQYRMLTLTSTGTLTLDSAVDAEVWMCGGGYNGQAGSGKAPQRTGGNGGNGGNFIQKSVKLATSNVIIIGSAGGGATSVTNLVSTADSGSYSGAGGGKRGTVNTNTYVKADGLHGAAAAISSLPFLDSYFTKLPCAGGGGGPAVYESGSLYAYGGHGGSTNKAGSGAYTNASKGGTTGGGESSNGGWSSKGGAATYYGSGGGGGCCSTSDDLTAGGSGYQGVVFIRIPLE